LERLGGLAAIEQAHRHNRNLELRFQPGNMYQSPLLSERSTGISHSSGSVMLVARIRRHKQQRERCETEILGCVDTVYSFHSIADFQYLPLRKRSDGTMEDLLPNLLPFDIPSALRWWSETPNANFPFFSPPYQFSRYNTPIASIFAQETETKQSAGETLRSVGQNTRVERKAFTINVNSSDPFPEAPTAEAIADAELRCKNAEPHRLLKDMFIERPLWTRQAIQARTGLDDSLLKYLLSKFAFYILSGPWGRLWCRFGYDPRRDREAVVYQTVVVSFRHHKNIPERKRLRCSVETRPAIDSNADLAWQYIPGELPSLRQMWYQICDIQLPEAERLLNGRRGDEILDTAYGRLPSNAVDLIRDAIKRDVARTTATHSESFTSTVDDEEDNQTTC